MIFDMGRPAYLGCMVSVWLFYCPEAAEACFHTLCGPKLPEFQRSIQSHTLGWTVAFVQGA